MDIEVYTFENRDGTPGDWSTIDIEEARQHAKEHRLRIIANTYEWTGSEALEDYSPKRRTKRKA